jgi:hypothetical protein
VSTEEAGLEIGEALLMLTSRMGQRAYRLPLFVQRQPITLLCINMTMKTFDCRNNQTKLADAPLMLTLET